MRLLVLFLGLLFAASSSPIMAKQATKSAGRPVVDARSSLAVKLVSKNTIFVSLCVLSMAHTRQVMQGKTPKEAKTLAKATCSEANIRKRVRVLKANGMKCALPAAGAIKMKTAFIRSSSQVDKMHQQKQKWRRLGSAAFKEVCLEAQKMKTAKLAGAVGSWTDRERQGWRPRREAPVHFLLSTSEGKGIVGEGRRDAAHPKRAHAQESEVGRWWLWLKS